MHKHNPYIATVKNNLIIIYFILAFVKAISKSFKNTVHACSYLYLCSWSSKLENYLNHSLNIFLTSFNFCHMFNHAESLWLIYQQQTPKNW